MKSKILILAIICSSYIHAEVLVFSKAYELALENSHEIKSSTYKAKSANEKVEQAWSQLYPQLDLSAYYKKSEYTRNPTNIESEQSLLNYSVTVQQSIYSAENYSRIDAEESRSKYSKITVELERQELAKKVFEAYLNVLKSKNKIELYKSYLQHRESKFEELKKKYDMRLANKMDLLEMLINYNSSKIDLEKEKKLYSTYQLKLKQLIGDDSYELPIIDSEKNIMDILGKLRGKTEAVYNSLYIKQAKTAVEISDNEIESAFDAHLPTLNFIAKYDKYDTDDPDQFAPYSNVQYFMFTLDIPLYTGGYTSSKVSMLEFEKQAAIEDLEKIKNDTIVQYDEYMAIFEATIESVSMYKKALESSRLYVESIEEGYQHGLKSISDLSDAENKLYEVKYKYIENIYEMVSAYINILIITDDFNDIEILDSIIM